MTVAELYERMDSREFTEWAVFDKIEREEEEQSIRRMEQENRRDTR